VRAAKKARRVIGKIISRIACQLTRSENERAPKGLAGGELRRSGVKQLRGQQGRDRR